MYIDIVPAQNHIPDHYSDYLQGYRAVRLLAEDSTILGELVWRVASGHNIEITEFGIFEEENKRKGWGTQAVSLGTDPELTGNQVLVDVAWICLNELTERDRVFLWTAGLLTIPEFSEEIWHLPT